MYHAELQVVDISEKKISSNQREVKTFRKASDFPKNFFPIFNSNN